MNKSKSSLFLMEILVSILLFSIASAVCVQVFVKASQLNKSSRELEQSLRVAQNFAEIMRNSKTPAETLQSLFPDAKVDRSEISVSFDQSFAPCPKESTNALYCAFLTFEETDNLHHMQIRIENIQTEQEIYSLKVSKYREEAGGVQ